MINETIAYIKHPVWVLSSPLEQKTLTLLAPARLIFEQLNMCKIDHLISLDGKTIEPHPVHNTRNHNTRFSSSITKIHRLATFILAFIAAIALTPLALFLHRIALRNHPNVRKAYDLFEEYQAQPGLIPALIGRWSDVKNVIKRTPDHSRDVFFKKTSTGLSLFSLLTQAYLQYPHTLSTQVIQEESLQLLINQCPLHHVNCLYGDIQSTQPPFSTYRLLDELIEKNKMSLLTDLIKKCPNDKISDYLILKNRLNHSLLSWIIQNKQRDLLSILIPKYSKDQIRLLFNLPESQALLKLVLSQKDSISLRLLDECPVDKLHLFFNVDIPPSKWSSELSRAFHNKLGKIIAQDANQVISWMTAIQSDGQTLLHRASIQDFFEPYLPILGIDLTTLLNQDGLTPIDLKTYSFDQSWIKKSKFQAFCQESISLKDYPLRAQSLKKNVLTLWESLTFGNQPGNLNPLLLCINQSQNNSFRIKKLLNEMLDKIVKKSPWLGTPRANNLDGLHTFYSEMLINFETIVHHLQLSNDPLLTAGYLVDIAKVEHEGRCAAAYQEEIEQKALLSSHHNNSCLTQDELIERAACKALRILVEETVANQSGSHVDVHSLRSANYACGLVPNPDPLDAMQSEFFIKNLRIREKVAHAFDLTSFLKNVSRNIDRDIAVECIKEMAPKIKPYSFLEKGSRFFSKVMLGHKNQHISLDQAYREAILKAKKMEEELTKETLEKIKKSGSSDSEKIFQAIKNLKTVILPLISNGEHLINKMIMEENEKLIAISGCQELNLMEIYKNNHPDFKKIESEVINFLKQTNHWNLQIRLKIEGKLSSILQKRIPPGKIFLNEVVKYTKKRGAVEEVIKIQKHYQAGILEILKHLTDEIENEEFDFSFDQGTYSLPSQALENNYKMWCSKADLAHQNRMILKILIHTHILAKKAPNQNSV